MFASIKNTELFFCMCTVQKITTFLTDQQNPIKRKESVLKKSLTLKNVK